MITVRKAGERGHVNHGWLNTYHTFSFASYYDPEYMGFRVLRVIKEDRVIGGAGFGTHSHQDMEIVTYVIEGALEHKDSLGTGSIIRPGDVQRMSAGTGISHSEFNASQSELVHFLQIWMLPGKKALKPEYEQKSMPLEERRGNLKLIVARDGRDGAVTVHQDADIYSSLLTGGDSASHALGDARSAWVQVVRGELTVNGTPLQAGDGAAIQQEKNLQLAATTDSELLLFDLP